MTRTCYRCQAEYRLPCVGSKTYSFTYCPTCMGIYLVQSERVKSSAGMKIGRIAQTVAKSGKYHNGKIL